jgi:integrase
MQCKLIPHKDAKDGWRVEIGKTLSNERPRRRIRRFFPTLEKAEAFVRALKAQTRDVGTSIRILRPADTLDAAEAIEALKRHAAKHSIDRPKLRDVVGEWLDRWNESHRSLPLGKLFDRFMETQDHSSLKHRQSLLQTKTKLKSLLLETVATIERDRIEDYLYGLAPASHNAHLRRIRSVLAFGVKHGYAKTNVALLITPVKRPKTSVQILPVQTVELMLRTAQQHRPDLLPFLCVSLFTGARAEEIGRLLWSDFNLPDRVLRIRPEVSKTERLRLIELQPNMVDWLQSFNRPANAKVLALTRGPLTVARGQLWASMRQTDATLPKHCPHNALRHLFVSMFLANGGTIDQLLLQSGHSSRIMFEHYLAAVSKADAAQFWQIRPTASLR